MTTGEEMPEVATQLDVRPLDGISAEGSQGSWRVVVSVRRLPSLLHRAI